MPYENRNNSAGGFTLKPHPILDVTEGPKPLGTIWFSAGVLAITIYPGEEIFDELWSRNVYGAAMPDVFSFSIKAEGGSVGRTPALGTPAPLKELRPELARGTAKGR